MWKPFALALSRQYRVYLLDRPGFGESPPEKPLHSEWNPENPMTKYDSDLARQSETFATLFKSWEQDWDGKKIRVDWGKLKHGEDWTSIRDVLQD